MMLAVQRQATARMGCGASKKIADSPDQVGWARDPGDYTLEYIELTPTGIPEFDAVFSQIENALSALVELNNECNDGIADIMSSHAACTGALQIDAAIGVADHDYVIVGGYCSNALASGLAKNEYVMTKLFICRHLRCLPTRRAHAA